MNLFRKLANRTTPIDETALRYIWLSLACGFASAAARELISAYHGAGAVYAEEDFSSRTDLSEPLRKRLSEKDLSDAQEIYKACREKGIGILTYESDLYPSRLRTLTNPPAVLYYRGRITNLDCEPCVAVVGTRSVSRYGEEVTDWFGYELAKSGAFVVSGLAKGADGIAHRAALRAGGNTVAVLGTAIDRVYPLQNEGLFSEIESKGLILSEYYPGCITGGASFPERNRIISGISMCTVVTEAGMTSGALITARSAIAQNRDVYAVPGSILVPGSDGTNHLIRGGVECVTCPAQVLEKYASYYPTKLRITQHSYTYERRAARENRTAPLPTQPPPAAAVPDGLPAVERRVYECIAASSAGLVLDEIAAALKLPPSQLMPILSDLEIQEYIRSAEGGKYLKV
ncbi:MAG TPA: DNA-processing protein DprA [Firmicutes bacterium]|nr:DNA-processing protein DprA [Bacillota bacterium]